MTHQEQTVRDRLLLVADSEIDPQFMATLSHALGVDVDVLSIDTTRGKRSFRLYRHLTYIALAFRAWTLQSRYQYTVFWQLFTGLYFSPLGRIALGNRQNSLRIALHLIYKPRQGRLGRLYRWLFGALLDSPAIDAFICHTSHEAELYGAEFGPGVAGKLRFVEYGVGNATNLTSAHFGGAGGRVFFAGGTSNRDYVTLVEAFRGRPEELRIFAFERDVTGIDLPPNVSVTSGVFDDGFAAAMRATDGVIVTLADPQIASGHLVLLEAMRQGKPIIATRGPCTSDLLDDSCAVRVEPYSVLSIREALDEVRDEHEWTQRMAENGRRRFESRFTIELYAERVAGQLTELQAGMAPAQRHQAAQSLATRAGDGSPNVS